MIKNYFKVAWRSLLRHKGFSLINIFGLSVGITCCVLVALFIKDEMSYDKYNKDANRLYRVVKDFVNDDGSKLPDATTPPAIGAAIQKDIPEIEHMVRFMPGWVINIIYAMVKKDLLKKTCTGPIVAFLMCLHSSFYKAIPKQR